MLTRKLILELLEMAKAYPVVTVIGPRQSGKTTLVRALFADKPYVSLENTDERVFATLDPKGFLARYPTGAILDEIQRCPELLSYLQGIVDEHKIKGMFILTGSHQLLLHESITQSLAGRTAILKLMPLSIAELPTETSLDIDQLLYHGMYPRLYADPMNPTKYYRDYVQTYVERDVRQMVQLKDLALFQRFLTLCAGRVGQLLNASNLSQELGVSAHTIEHWISILEASFILFRLQPYHENLGKRLIKAPKLYFVDVGLAAYLLDITNVSHISRDPLRGNLFENFVVMECIKEAFNHGYEPPVYFYRDSQNHEIDLLFKHGNMLVPIEIKSSKTFHQTFMKNLYYFQELFGPRCPQGYLLYGGDVTQRVGSFEITTLRGITAMVSSILAS